MCQHRGQQGFGHSFNHAALIAILHDWSFPNPADLCVASCSVMLFNKLNGTSCMSAIAGLVKSAAETPSRDAISPTAPLLLLHCHCMLMFSESSKADFAALIHRHRHIHDADILGAAVQSSNLILLCLLQAQLKHRKGRVSYMPVTVYVVRNGPNSPYDNKEDAKKDGALVLTYGSFMAP